MAVWKVINVVTKQDFTTNDELILGAIKHTENRSKFTHDDLVKLWENLEGVKYNKSILKTRRIK